MNTVIQQTQKLIRRMTKAEKAQVLQLIVQDLGDTFPGIEKRPNVVGGAAYIIRTRIPVWLLAQAKQLGASESQLLEAYPSLRAEDLVNAWAYIQTHSEEIDRQIAENEA